MQPPTTNDEYRQEILTLLGEAILEAKAAADQFDIPASNERHKFATTLFCTIVSLADSVRVLGRARSPIAVTTITRQALDAYIDLTNVIRHEDYWLRLELHDSQVWKGILETVSAGDNPVLRALYDNPELPEVRKVTAQHLKDLKSKGIVAASIEARFELAEQGQIYSSLYKLLSACAHNNTSMLRALHKAWRPNEKSVTLFPTDAPYEIPAYLQLVQIVAFAVERMDSKFGGGKLAGVVQKLTTRVGELDSNPLAGAG